MSGWPTVADRGHAEPVTTRLGTAVIVAAVVLLALRATGYIDNELVDIASVLGLVVGALAVAIDGE
jgi:heme A synthase